MGARSGRVLYRARGPKAPRTQGPMWPDTIQLSSDSDEPTPERPPPQVIQLSSDSDVDDEPAPPPPRPVQPAPSVPQDDEWVASSKRRRGRGRVIQSDEQQPPPRRRPSPARAEDAPPPRPRGPGGGSAQQTAEFTELCRLMVSCKTYGQHFGGSRTSGVGIAVHSDHSVPIDQMIAQLESDDDSADPRQFQVAHYHVVDLSQCTQVLYVLDTATNRHQELSIRLYVAWLRWLRTSVPRAEELDALLRLGGKQNWPDWTIDTFKEFQHAHGSAHPQDASKLIVLRTPPPDMHPAFSGGWVTLRWLQGSPHAGFKVDKRLGAKLYRTVMFYTEPDSNGQFISDLKGKKSHPSFERQFDELRWEMDSLIRSEPNAAGAARRLDERTAEWEKRYRITCMSGPSHARFVARVVRVVATQPTREQMLATLWHTGHLEMPLTQDPRALTKDRARMIERAQVEMGRVRYTTVASTNADCCDALARVLRETHDLQMTRLHNYLANTSGLAFQRAPDFATLYADQRKQFRKGPHRGRGNISDSCWRCTEAGFGIFGAIFVFPHEIISDVLRDQPPGALPQRWIADGMDDDRGAAGER